MHKLNRYSISINCGVGNGYQKQSFPNLTKIASTWLLTATAIVGWSNFFGQVTIARTIQQQEISQTNDPPVDEKEGGRTGGPRFTSASVSCYPNFYQT